MLKDNPQYVEVFQSKVHGIALYGPADLANGYHLSRYVAAGAQNIYSASGSTKDYLQALTDKMLQLCNDEKSVKTLRTDITACVHNLQYRLKYPVDEDCAIRMGAIYCFIEGEDPEQVSDIWTRKKMSLAKGDSANGIQPDPDMYAFFLSTGIVYTPSWNELSELSEDYFLKRKETLESLTPFSLLKTG